jgi:hypothetical protein
MAEKEITGGVRRAHRYVGAHGAPYNPINCSPRHHRYLHIFAFFAEREIGVGV